MANSSSPPTQEPAQCPVDHAGLTSALGIDHQRSPTAPTPDAASQCPVSSNKDNPVTLPLVNPFNQMPNICQLPDPDQTASLSTLRAKSTIPRAQAPLPNQPAPPDNTELPQVHTSTNAAVYDAEDGDNSAWVYPSEQMFYNAMKRKNWQPNERDMKSVVEIHNQVNEVAWKKVLEWEQLHASTCPMPKLLRFEGRPQDITPKARFRSWFGYKLPFDRHDWVVDRCGQQVTYIIDFYSGSPTTRTLPGTTSSVTIHTPSFYLDVRPKLTPQGFVDRVRRLFSDA
ncbi:Cytochrome c1 heme lyase [Dimargaris verticillata]|uniref:Holocytochrome c-type synthase n=1 Tax=Dimargaris verticillata TaxID=2761393 RepID=A0A9W8B5Z2_9FUNG|nr:Cytochrome c1 heme lyase [Dimargaris verticillata]